ncbi:MAG: cyclic nucleotide-binding domain-containing protein [Myxococcota bacterium]
MKGAFFGDPGAEALAADDLAIGRLERVILIRSFPGYGELPADEVATLANRFVERRYAKGELLEREHVPVGHVHFLARGRVQLRREGRVLRELGHHSIVGGISALSGDRVGYDVEALEPTVTLRIPVDELLEVFEDNYVLLESAVRGLSREVLKVRRELLPSGGFAPSDWQPGGQAPAPLDLVERIAALRRSFPLEGTRLEAIADLARDVEEVRVAPGERLFALGEIPDGVYFVVFGAVKGSSPEGFDLRFGPGDVVGSLGASADLPRWYTAVAETELVLLRLDRDALLDVLEDHHSVAVAMLRALARSLLDGIDEASRRRAPNAAG